MVYRDIANNLPTLPYGYEYIEEIGAGNSSVAWLVLNKNLGVRGRQETIKILHTIDQNTHKFFDQRVNALALLHHPNLITIYQVNPQEFYYFTEYLERGSLQTLIDAKQLSLSLGLQTIKQIAEGLHFSHNNGLIHNNLSPKDILFSSTMTPKITNFGIDQNTSAQGSKIHYIAPEQWQNLHTDNRLDIWSLGIILYQILAARLPFEKTSKTDFCKNILANPIVSPLATITAPSPLQQALENVCMKMLRKDPQNRYQSMEEVALVLEDILHQFSTSAPEPVPENKTKSFPKQEREIIASAKKKKCKLSFLFFAKIKIIT